MTTPHPLDSWLPTRIVSFGKIREYSQSELAEMGRAAWNEMIQAHKQGRERAMMRHNQAWLYYNNLMREGKYTLGQD